jgi:predicted nuclease of predicted toxin-antitoxin system
MRVLLDECLPERLRDELPGHQVRTAREAGLAGKKNGLLMELASTQFDVLVTVDRGIPSQQNTTNISLAVVLIHARSNSFPALAVLLPQLREAVAVVMPGQVLRVKRQRGQLDRVESE